MFGYDSISLNAATSSCMYECSKWGLDVGLTRPSRPIFREDSSGGPGRCTDVLLCHCVDVYLLFFTIHLRSHCCDMPIA